MRNRLFDFVTVVGEAGRRLDSQQTTQLFDRLVIRSPIVTSEPLEVLQCDDLIRFDFVD